ncbi:hypothetical protein [Larkinella harenae]
MTPWVELGTGLSKAGSTSILEVDMPVRADEWAFGVTAWSAF